MMMRRVAGLAACVALAVCVGCERPDPRADDAPGSTAAAPGTVERPDPLDPVPDVRALSDEELADRVARLRELIIPPRGTAVASVDRVYGEPRIEEELPAGAKGSPASYPMRSYDLLPPDGRAEFRAFLHVTARDEVVASAGINHYCVIKNRRAGAGSEALQRALRAEQQRVLRDLEAIREKYRVELQGATWAR